MQAIRQAQMNMTQMNMTQMSQRYPQPAAVPAPLPYPPGPQVLRPPPPSFAQLAQASVHAQLEAMRQRQIQRAQQLMQEQAQRERREAELKDEQDAMAAGSTNLGVIADAAVVDAEAQETVGISHPNENEGMTHASSLHRRIP